MKRTLSYKEAFFSFSMRLFLSFVTSPTENSKGAIPFPQKKNKKDLSLPSCFFSPRPERLPKFQLSQLSMAAAFPSSPGI